MTGTKKIKVGLIGFGLSGRHFHTPLLKAHRGFDIVTVLTSRSEELAMVLPQAKAVGSVDAILSDPAIDLVINTAPNEFHYSYSAQALEAGKHVVVEKPFVNTSEEGEKLLKLAQSKGKALTVFQNRRWDGDFLTVKKLLEENAVGELTHFESHFDRFRPLARPERWREQARAGSGALYDLGSHLIDQALCLFGLPDEVFADLENQRPGSVTNDYFHLIFKYGAKRVILHSTSFSETSPRFVLQGSSGSFIRLGLDPQEESLKAGLSPIDSGYGTEDSTQWGTLAVLRDGVKEVQKIPSERGSYGTFYEELYSYLCQEERCRLPVDPADSLAVIKLLELCANSSCEGRFLKVI